MRETRTSSAVELLVELRRDDQAPLHQQLERELRAAIRSGRLPPESALPSTRALADQLQLSRGVAVEAYEQLVAEGYLTSRPGAPTRVSARVAAAVAGPSGPTAASASPGQSPPGCRIDFAYGRPDVTQFPRSIWLRSLKRVLADTPSARLAYLDERGAPELRLALAVYLNRVRGTAADADRIVICNGFAQALNLLAEVLRTRGVKRLAMEDPGQTDTPEVASRMGLRSVPIPVDEDGIDVSALERTDAEAVVLTPAHHFPTGAVLSAERRTALLSWARAGRRLILEDDYDAEYRYDREPIGALQGLAPEHVIYAGSASKTLAPGLRLGWLIAPSDLVWKLAATKMAIDRGSPSLEQLAFADFVSTGEFDHHLRRMRAVYRKRRDMLMSALRSSAPDVAIAGASAGLHVVAWLPDGVGERAVTERAAGLGVRVSGVAKYRVGSTPSRPGLLFGYGTLRESEIEEGVRLVAQAIDDVRAAVRPRPS